MERDRGNLCPGGQRGEWRTTYSIFLKCLYIFLKWTLEKFILTKLLSKISLTIYNNSLTTIFSCHFKHWCRLQFKPIVTDTCHFKHHYYVQFRQGTFPYWRWHMLLQRLPLHAVQMGNFPLLVLTYAVSKTVTMYSSNMELSLTCIDKHRGFDSGDSRLRTG